MLYTVAALAALAGTRYQVPMAAPPAEGLPNPNAGKVNDKIEHFVVLMMENRTPDHFFACMGLPKGDWVKEGHVIPMDPKDPSKGGATIKCGEAEYACKSGPGYDMFAGKVEPGGEDNFYPYGAQSDDNSYAHGAHGTSIQLFGKDALPVKKKIAEVFSIFKPKRRSTSAALVRDAIETLLLRAARSRSVFGNSRSSIASPYEYYNA